MEPGLIGLIVLVVILAALAGTFIALYVIEKQDDEATPAITEVTTAVIQRGSVTIRGVIFESPTGGEQQQEEVVFETPFNNIPSKIDLAFDPPEPFGGPHLTASNVSRTGMTITATRIRSEGFNGVIDAGISVGLITDEIDIFPSSDSRQVALAPRDASAWIFSNDGGSTFTQSIFTQPANGSNFTFVRLTNDRPALVYLDTTSSGTIFKMLIAPTTDGENWTSATTVELTNLDTGVTPTRIATVTDPTFPGLTVLFSVTDNSWFGFNFNNVDVVTTTVVIKSSGAFEDILTTHDVGAYLQMFVWSFNSHGANAVLVFRSPDMTLAGGVTEQAGNRPTFSASSNDFNLAVGKLSNGRTLAVTGELAEGTASQVAQAFLGQNDQSTDFGNPILLPDFQDQRAGTETGLGTQFMAVGHYGENPFVVYKPRSRQGFTVASNFNWGVATAVDNTCTTWTNSKKYQHRDNFTMPWCGGVSARSSNGLFWNLGFYNNNSVDSGVTFVCPAGSKDSYDVTFVASLNEIIKS